MKALSDIITRILSFGIMAIFMISSVGVFHMSMNMGADGHMHCPFSQGSSVCSMSPIDHIAAAQNLFTALPHNQFSTVLLLILGLASISFFVRFFSPPKVVFEHSITSRNSPPRNYLQEAFSGGILNPKPF